MYTEHKTKIIAGIAAAFLAAFAVFYESVVTFVTHTFVTPPVVQVVVEPPPDLIDEEVEAEEAENVILE